MSDRSVPKTTRSRGPARLALRFIRRPDGSRVFSGACSESRSLAFCAGVAVALMLLTPMAVTAEIYKWKDADGRLHFSQDLSRVPPQYRKQAESGVRNEGEGPEIQQYRVPASAGAPSKGIYGRSKSGRTVSGQRASKAKPAEIHRIRVAKTGSSMRVTVRLNDSIDVPFIIDTGASDVLVPAWAAKKMDLDLSEARTKFYSTANGVVEQSVLILESVSLGTARATNVPASVSPSMSVGLLGLSFFNHFRYNIDPVAGIVTLEDNGLAEEGHLRGGRTRDQWQYAFRNLHHRRDKLEEALDDVGSSRSRRRAEIEAMIVETDRQLGVLDGEADDARVPMQWRD